MKYLVSVIIPLFNKRDYIVRALRSVHYQSYQNWEMIIINDGSTDGSDVVAQQYLEWSFCNLDNRAFMVSQPNLGVASARNCGITMSNGNIIAFLDADDEWLPFHLEEICYLASRYPSSGFFATAFKRLRRSCNSRNPFYVSGSYFYLRSRGVAQIITSGVAVRTQTIKDIGGFDEALRISEDVDLYNRLSLLGPISFSSRQSVCYHDDIPIEKRLSGDKIIRKRWTGSARRNLLTTYSRLPFSEKKKRDVLCYLVSAHHKSVLSWNISGVVKAIKADGIDIGVSPYLLGFLLFQTLVQRGLHCARIRIPLCSMIPIDGVHGLEFEKNVLSLN